MSLTIEVVQVVGAFQLEVTTMIGGGLTALVGPSGAGKTTLLNVLAGLTRPTRGRIRLDEDRLVDTATGAWVPPHRRRIGYVFQEPRLLPHLTVRQNLRYGRWGRPGTSHATSETDVVELLDLSAFLARYPQRLSGGEKQRVALGRALLTDPRLLLLDEPLASVDASHRTAILPYLDRIRAEHAMPTIYVTHTWPDVASRAHAVLELGAGRIAFTGSVAEAEARRLAPREAVGSR